MQLVRTLFLILLFFAPLSGVAVQSAWSGHPQYVVIKPMEEKKEEKAAKPEKNQSTKNKRAPQPVEEEEYYDDDDDDYFNFEPPSPEEMESIFQSLSQVFAMNGPGADALVPPLG